jgi:O-antigen/teichoic acid export membrane protein
VIGRRTLLAARWQALANVLRMVATFVRFVTLARLLPVETFGVYALALAVVRTTSTLPQFGLTAAFLHRAPETEQEEPAASVLFTLRLGFVAVWALALAAGAAAWAEGSLRTALLALAACSLVAEPAFVPRQLLTRRLRYRRIALYVVLDAVIGSGVSIALALAGAGLWALLATDAVAAALQLAVFLGFAPPWRPRLRLEPRVIAYFLRFGSQGFGAAVVDRVLERLPDLWLGAVMGKLSLGFYSRARRLAAYPGQLVTDPLVTVLPATYAELGPRPAALAEAARDSLGVLARAGAGLAAVVLVAAPLLVEGLLGPRWLPALAPLRVLSLLLLLEPLRLALTSLLVALGRPGRVARLRAAQLALLVVGLLAGAGFGTTWAIAGAVVLAAAGGTAALGAALYADLPLSWWRVLAAPLVAGAAAIAAGSAVAPADWAEPAAAAATYAGVLAVLDGAELWRLARGLRRAWSAR